MTIDKNKKSQGISKLSKKRNPEISLRKDWFSVTSPKEFGEKNLGTTLANKSSNTSRIIQSLKDRNYRISLADIKNSEDSSSKKLIFRCYDYDTKNCLTGFHGMEISRDKFCSFIRKWQTMIEVNSDIKTKDGFFLRIFVVAFSRKRKNQSKKSSYIKTSQIRTIRRKMVEIITRECTTCNLKDLIPKIISEKLVDEIGFHGSKIFPLRNVVIRKIKVLEKTQEIKMNVF